MGGIIWAVISDGMISLPGETGSDVTPLVVAGIYGGAIVFSLIPQED